MTRFADTKTISKQQEALGELHPDIIGFREEVAKKFPNVRYTSGLRPRAFTKQGKISRHATGEAVDAVAEREFYNFLTNDREGISLMNKYNLGILDETSAEMLAKTGGTGAHYHIGKDMQLVAQTKARFNKLGEMEVPKRTKLELNENLPVQYAEQVQIAEKPKEEDEAIDVAKQSLELKMGLKEQFLTALQQAQIQPLERVVDNTPQQIEPFRSPYEGLMQDGGKINFDNLPAVSDFTNSPFDNKLNQKKLFVKEVNNTSNSTLNKVNPILPKMSDKEKKILQDKTNTATKQKESKRLTIQDNRKINLTNNQPINSNTDLVSGEYSQEVIDNILRVSKNEGVDPYTALAIGLQETKLGEEDENVGHVLGKHKGVDRQDPYIDYIKVLKNKFDEADRLGITDEAKRLQVYNGMGIVTPRTESKYHGYEMQKIYGVPIPKEGINMKENPLYGKRILDLRDNVLKQNPELVKYVESFQQGGIIEDNQGQWKYPGEITKINSNNITMEGVNYPVLGISNTGDVKMMYPWENYQFEGESVTEYPIIKKKLKLKKK